MTRHNTQILLALVGLLLLATFATWDVQAQSCTITCNAPGGAGACNPGGMSLSTAISSAANGSTICLNSGNYGTVNLFDMQRTGYVTVQSASGTQTATLSPQPGNSRFMRFQNLTVPGSVVNSCSRDIEFINNNFGSNQLLIRTDGCSPTTGPFLVEGNTFGPYDASGSGIEGRLELLNISNVTVRNNIFSNGGCSDGIQIVGTSNITIGPNNTFLDLRQGSCGPHVDSFQIVPSNGSNIILKQNFFKNGDTFIMAPDGSSGVLVEHNVFDGTGVANIDKIQFGSAASPIFRHNTVRNVQVSFDSKPGKSASSNVLAENNVMHGGTTRFKTSNGSGCSTCTFRFSLYDDTGDQAADRGCSGCSWLIGNVIGTPSYVGGASPTTYAGFALNAGSPGKNAGNNGRDMGISASGSQTPSGNPTNLRVIGWRIWGLLVRG